MQCIVILSLLLSTHCYTLVLPPGLTDGSETVFWHPSLQVIAPFSRRHFLRQRLRYSFLQINGDDLPNFK